MVVLDASVVPVFVEKARQHPDRVFARFNGVPVTFGEIDRRSAALAAALRRAGIAKGDRAAVMLHSSVDSLTVLFGLARAGVVWVPVNVQLRADGLRYILEHCEPRAVIAEAGLAGTIAECGADLSGAVLRVRDPERPDQGLGEWLYGGAAFDEPAPAASDQFAIMYTSGTTGRPKGVMVTHRMLCLAGQGVLEVSSAVDGDVFFVWEPLYHIGGAQLIALPVLRDIELAMVDRFSASRFWQQVNDYRATHIHYLGGILQILLKQPASPLERSHNVRVAWGGGCPPEIFDVARERYGFAIRECYGMTEDSSITTFSDGSQAGVVGRPVPWFTVTIRDDRGEPVPAGVRGEITVQTSLPGAIFDGYFRNPEATAKALRGGVMYTGDCGSMDEAGVLRFHGRLTDSVRCRGENVSAWEVEHVVTSHPAVEDCAIIGVAAEIGEQEIKLFVKPKAGAQIVPAELSAWLSKRLAPYQNPRYVAMVEEFERTPSLRIMKHRLDPSVAGAWDRQNA
jgi:crotonobetaine/carnitine-CoA ligase